MKLSVSILAYNHENYIATAIESALNQKTDFDFEIIIGEDESSDNTRTIVKSFEKKYPDKIRVFYHSYSKNFMRTTGWLNFVNNFKAAKGKYVAYLDGDDYWTDPYKLQKQVDTLDQNDNYIICHHNVNYLTKGEIVRARHEHQIKKEIDVFDLIKENLIVMSSCVYRNIFSGDFPDFFSQINTVDRFLNIYHLQYGKAYYIDEIMGVYRADSGGIHNRLKKIRRTKNRISDMQLLMKNLPTDYSAAIEEQIGNLKTRLLKQRIKKIIGY